MDRVTRQLADLRNPQLFVREARVPIFDEHEEVYWTLQGKDGRTVTVPAGTPKAQRRVRRFTKADLLRLARNQNARESRGDLAPIVLGHTNPDEHDETKQPPVVGFAADYAVGFDPRRGRHMLYADYCIHADRYQLAREYPRTSIELWPSADGDDLIDPISLLKRTPQRDLGQWTFGRSGRAVLRYSMETPMADFDPGAAGAPGGGAPPAEPSPAEMSEQYMRHCFSHPFAKKLSLHYGMGDEGAGLPPGLDAPGGDPGLDAAGGDPPADPTGGPPDDLPLQNSAAAASGTNGALPAGLPPEQMSRGGLANQYRRDGDAVRVARLERQVQQLTQYGRVQEHARRTAEARQVAAQLVAEGFDLDEAVEVPRMAAMAPAEQAAHAQHVRRFYRQAPTAQYARIPVDDAPARLPGGDDGQPDPAHFERALTYMREKPGRQWAESLTATKKA